MDATLIDFYVNVIAIAAWVIYKEANWISAAVWVVLLFCFGSAATCAYIVKKLFEVAPTGPSQDALDLLFIRQGNLSRRKCSYVIIGRIVFSILGIFMAAVVTYTVNTDGLPFRKELLTPWMAATLIDFYINIFAISVWVAHKESSWISTAIWIILLICFGRQWQPTKFSSKRSFFPESFLAVPMLHLDFLPSSHAFWPLLTLITFIMMLWIQFSLLLLQ
ncbi:unnamed protein product [Urochloa decumbens]|uniref:Uncharacterized protein n=1 Tax=Urochloa decumbens TaxID=240449 RepID=A0ABC9E0Z0_9POAL